jgi:hypothetical protein
MVRYAGFDASPANLMQLAYKMHEPRWIKTMTIQEKVFFYFFNTLLAKTYDGQMLISRPTYEQLQSHIFAQTTEEKIMNAGLQYSQPFLWGIKPFLKEHVNKPYILRIPPPPPAPKKLVIKKKRRFILKK